MIPIVFFALSVLAIVAGGALSAFSARRATRFTAWLSAYLVLVVGVIQAGLVAAWYGLGQPEPTIACFGFLLYDIGNGAVIAGTMVKTHRRYASALVNGGGILIALAMIGLLFAINGAPVSPLLVVFIALVLIILISMPIGLVLSHRRHE